MILVTGATIAGQGMFALPAGDAKVSVVDTRDVAEVAARVLVDKGHDGKAYEITGPAAVSHARMAAELSEAPGRTVRFVDLAPEAMREKLFEAGMERWQADGLMEDYDHYRRRSSPRDFGGTGKDARSFAEFARDYAERFVGA